VMWVQVCVLVGLEGFSGFVGFFLLFCSVFCLVFPVYTACVLRGTLRFL
jgi:hypothetical protein